MSTLKTPLFLTLLAMVTGSVRAASPGFQDFLFQACRTAEPGSDFFIRCNVDSANGDLSGDSEDSLNPTQSLANGTNALAETRARIKALREKITSETEDGEQEDTDIKTVFRMNGLSLIINIEDGSSDRKVTSLERGYETDSNRLQIGLDYRTGNNLLLGMIAGFGKFDTVYDADQPGRNFVPGSNEGKTSGDDVSLSAFISGIIGENGYFDAIVSYSWSDYRFNRIGIFQESSRTLPTLTVATSASTNGNELAVSTGFGYDRNWDATLLQTYGRISYQRSSIDPYTESGGAGFAMNIRNDNADELTGIFGLRLSRSWNRSFGVLVPQIFVEYENAFRSDRRNSTQSFVADTSGFEFTVTGDKPDDSQGRAGTGILATFPNGFTGFVQITRTFGNRYIDETRINAGIRREF